MTYVRKSRKLTTILLFSLCLTILLSTSVHSQSNANPAVFRIAASECKFNPYSRTQTGFWIQDEEKGILGIVTALHGVADCEKIKAENDDGFIADGLKIIKVDIDRDVALLEGEELDNVSSNGLTVETSLVGLRSEDLYVIGYPVNLGTQRSTNLKYLGLKKLRELIPEDANILTPLDRRNSPNLNFEMLDLQGHLLPGHSGAPIFNQKNKLIGVGNGGLASGTIGIGWAIPWQDIDWKPISADEERFANLKENSPSLFSFTIIQNRIFLEPKIACKSAIGYDSLAQLKQDLLKDVKSQAADEFLSRDYVRIAPVLKAQVRTLATEYVRIAGSEQYYNNDTLLANLCVSIAPYILEEDEIQPIERRSVACVPGSGDYQQLQKDAEEKAIIQALERYNPDLKDLDKDQKLRLMRQQIKAEFEFQGAQICATVTGEIFPLEILAVLAITPTLTTSSTSTPLSHTLTPTATNAPIPTAEAIVVASNGLNLRSGPGTIYAPPIGFLNNGDILKVLGRIANNEWLKVLVVNQDREGWVATAPNLVKINVDLNPIPIVTPPPLLTPTPYPTSEVPYQFEYGPILYEPKEWVTYSVGENVRFTWERFELKPDQIYSVRVVLDVEPEVEACIHVQVGNPPDPSRDPELYLDLDCPSGGYYWSVVVATELPEGSEYKWREDSEENHRNHFGIGVPHPNTPPDLGGDTPPLSGTAPRP